MALNKYLCSLIYCQEEKQRLCLSIKCNIWFYLYMYNVSPADCDIQENHDSMAFINVSHCSLHLCGMI